jgi:hypothetical protein
MFFTTASASAITKTDLSGKKCPIGFIVASISIRS